MTHNFEYYANIYREIEENLSSLMAESIKFSAMLGKGFNDKFIKNLLDGIDKNIAIRKKQLDYYSNLIAEYSKKGYI